MVLGQAGDQEAYAALLRDLRDYSAAVLAPKLVDQAQLDDFLQDILLSVHRARHTYDHARPFLPWFHAILRFRLTDALRKIYKTKEFEALDPEAGYPDPSPVTFGEAPANEDLAESLEAALGQLTDKQRRIVRSLKVDGLSIKETAAREGMSESAVKVSAHRAYKAMRTFLKGRGSAGEY